MTLYRETPCDSCGVFHVGGKRDDPGAGCWAKPGGSREVVTVDYQAAAMEYLLSTGRYENPVEVWGNVPLTVRIAAEEYSARIVDAALHTEKEPASTP